MVASEENIPSKVSIRTHVKQVHNKEALENEPYLQHDATDICSTEVANRVHALYFGRPGANKRFYIPQCDRLLGSYKCYITSQRDIYDEQEPWLAAAKKDLNLSLEWGITDLARLRTG